MHKVAKIVVLTFLLFLTACNTSSPPIDAETATIAPVSETIAPTVPLPTQTATFTPTSNPSPTATDTPSPTMTNTPTPSPSPQPTTTPIPEQSTFSTATPMTTRVTTETASLLDMSGAVTVSLAWSPDGNHLYIGSRENGLFAFDVNSQEMIYESGGDGTHVQALAVSPDGKTLAVGLGNDGSIRFVSAATGDLLQTIWPAHDDWPQVLAYSPDGRILASGGDDGQIFLWDATTGEMINGLFQGDHWVWSLAFSPDGERLIAGFDLEGIFRVWDTETWEIQSTFPGDVAADLVFSSDGNKFVTATGGRREVNLWDSYSGERLFNLTGSPGWVWAVAYDPQDRFVASGGIGEIIILWDVMTGEAIRELYMGGEFIQALAFNPDGTKLASGGGEVLIWDMSEP